MTCFLGEGLEDEEKEEEEELMERGEEERREERRKRRRGADWRLQRKDVDDSRRDIFKKLELRKE